MNKLLFPLLALLAAVGMYFLFISPTYEEIKLHQAKEEEFDKAFLEIREVKNLLEELESSYATISRDDLLRLEKFLPKEVDMPRIIQNLAGIIESHGLPVEGIGAEGASKDENENISGLLRHEIGFSVDTSYENFLEIIADIENNIQLASVTTISLSPTVVGDEELNVAPTKYGVTLTMYSYK